MKYTYNLIWNIYRGFGLHLRVSENSHIYPKLFICLKKYLQIPKDKKWFFLKSTQKNTNIIQNIPSLPLN